MKAFNEKDGWFVEKRCAGELYEGVGCNSLLIIETEDLYLSDKNIYRDTGYYYSAKCPICGLVNEICYKDIPYDIRLAFEEKTALRGKTRIRLP